MEQSGSLDFCVLIPCYNNSPGLVQAVNSIHYPTKKYLVVVVDDGSDVPVTLQELLLQTDERKPIHLIRNEKNSGITDALNTGLRWIVENIATPYIARLDCSDVCVASRFTDQVNYLNQHTETSLIGSWCYFKEEHSPVNYAYTTPTRHSEIKKSMYLRNVFIHPTVMFRRTLLEKVGFYPYEYPYAEDYALFWKMLNVSQTAILDQFLVTCAVSRTGLSMAHRQDQLRSRRRVVAQLGNSYLLKTAGLMKLYLLQLLPAGLVLKLKNIK